MMDIRQDIRQFINKSNMFNLEDAIASSSLWNGMPKHWGKDPSKFNNTIDYLDEDEKNQFEKELIENPNHPFKDKKITYSFDKNGYRQGIDSENFIYCFGCCHTLGWGLANEDLWPHKLHTKINDSNVGYKNFGTLSGINDNIARTAFQAIKFSKDPIKAVFVVFTPLPAMEYYTKKNQSVNFIPGSHRMRQLQKYGSNSFNFDELSEEYKDYLGITNKVYCFYNFVKNYQLIELLCKSMNIPFYWYTHCSDVLNISLQTLSKFLDVKKSIVDKFKLKDVKDPADLSRDGTHFGEKFHTKIAEGFYELYSNGMRK